MHTHTRSFDDDSGGEGEGEYRTQKMMLADRYARGFKYCSHCGVWYPPGAEIYYSSNSNTRPLCPECRRILKTRPRGSEAKDRMSMFQTGKRLPRY